MKNTKLADDVVNEQAEVISRKCSGGYVDVMSGEQPEGVSEAANPDDVLVSVRFADPAFTDAAFGSILSNPLIAGVALRDGEPKWFRAYRADHITPVWDGSAGTEKANMILPVARIVRGMTIGAAQISYTVVKSLPGV